MENVIARVQNLKINLNNRVRFRIRPGCESIFEEPGIDFGGRDADGWRVAEAQFHALIEAMAPHIRTHLQPPISPEFEVIVGAQS